MAVIDLVPYEYGGVRLLTRQGEYAAFDQGITREVQHGYFNDLLRSMTVRTVIDVGAHIGAFTLWARRVWVEAEIVAVEAERENYDLLVVNTSDTPGIKAMYARVGYCAGDFKILKAIGNSGGHIIVPVNASVSSQYRAVAAPEASVTIEALMQQRGWDTLDLLKLDCEGCECDVIEYISPALLGSINVIVGERHQPREVFMRGAGQRLTLFHSVLWADSPDPHLGTFLAINKER